MMYLFAKAALSGVIIAAVSEIARRSPALGALVASLPLVSLLAVIWLWRDTADVERIAAHLREVLAAAGAVRLAPSGDRRKP